MGIIIVAVNKKTSFFRKDDNAKWNGTEMDDMVYKIFIFHRLFFFEGERVDNGIGLVLDDDHDHDGSLLSVVTIFVACVGKKCVRGNGN